MRRLFLSSVFAVSLAGCATLGVTPVDISSFVTQVQAITSTACSFLPTAETVASILATGNPIVATANAVANAICAAVAPAKTAGKLSTTVPTVAGVVIHGKFLR
jgi:hypothetical protein